MATDSATNVVPESEIYTYKAPWPLYSMAWNVRPGHPFRLAIGSFVEEYTNKIRVVELEEGKEGGPPASIVMKAEVDHPYPATKVLWIPDTAGSFPDLFCTTGDYMRIWKMGEDGNSAKMECLLNNNKSSEFCAPLTAFDWNEADPTMLGTASIDTTCTIWDLRVGAPKAGGEVKTQLIAHDMEVYDMAFASVDIFASVGADGSLRMFDLRNLEHSTILFEEPSQSPLLRVAWNKVDRNFVSVVRMDSNEVYVLDVRMPSTPCCTLSNHEAPVDGVAWAPSSSTHICTAGDDRKALIWDISSLPKAVVDPILAYESGGAINNVQWSKANPDWIAICYDDTIEALRV